jgi:hypothetical protein
VSTSIEALFRPNLVKPLNSFWADVQKLLGELFKRTGCAGADAELLGLLAGLRDQEVVRAKVDYRPLARIESRLEHEQADQRLALSRVELDDDVARVGLASVPLTKHRVLRRT